MAGESIGVPTHVCEINALPWVIKHLWVINRNRREGAGRVLLPRYRDCGVHSRGVEHTVDIPARILQL